MKKFIILLLVSITLFESSFSLYKITPKNEPIVAWFIKKIEKRKFSESKINLLISQLQTIISKYKWTNSEILINDIISWLNNYKESKFKTEILYSVIKVVDWDTIKINYNWEEKDVRILWLDTPEKYTTRTGYKECYWEEASDFATKELSWKKVIIEQDETQDNIDKYWRLLAHVFYYDDSWNKIYYEENAIKNGYWLYYLYKVPTKYDDILIKAQEEAKDDNLGMWKMCGWKRIPLNQMIEQTQSKVNNILNNNMLKIPDMNNSTTNFSCWTKTTCSEMASCEEAKFYLNTCWKSKLDWNKDWTPCESICK